MGIATIAGVILGLTVVGVSFALTSLVGPAADAGSIGLILGGCALGGAGSFVIAHMLGLPRIVVRAQAALSRTRIGARIERRAGVLGVISAILGLVAMVVVIRDPGFLGGLPAVALFASVGGAVLLNAWWRLTPGPLDESIKPDFGGAARARTRHPEDLKTAA
jgi:hypothetical protein